MGLKQTDDDTEKKDLYKQASINFFLPEMTIKAVTKDWLNNVINGLNFAPPKKPILQYLAVLSEEHWT